MMMGASKQRKIKLIELELKRIRRLKRAQPPRAPREEEEPLKTRARQVETCLLRGGANPVRANSVTLQQRGQTRDGAS